MPDALHSARISETWVRSAGRSTAAARPTISRYHSRIVMKIPAMRSFIRVLFTIAALLPAVGAAQFKWIDADGRVNYGDVPPPDARPPAALRSAAPPLRCAPRRGRFP
jgi:hypothetical protein